MNKNSLARFNRIKESITFNNIKKEGICEKTNNLVVLRRQNKTSNSRVGIVASRKVGNSVVRNRWKRSIREIFRCELKEKFKGFDLLFIVRKSDPVVEKKQIHKVVSEEIGKLFQNSQN